MERIRSGIADFVTIALHLFQLLHQERTISLSSLGIKMKKLASILALSAFAAFALPAQVDTAKKDTTKKIESKKDTAKKVESKKLELKKDTAKVDTTKKK